SVEDRIAELRLQIGHTLSDCRLGHPDSLCGSGKGTVACGGNNILKASVYHVDIPIGNGFQYQAANRGRSSIARGE
ncbi:UNVERIFIED_CONTAM: hypothetical protein NY100_19650, partial [Prevotella sp. 15_C9]